VYENLYRAPIHLLPNRVRPDQVLVPLFRQYINLKYKVFILFYIDNVQVMFYKSDKVLANKIIAKINIAYALYLIREVKWFLGVCIIKD
jgi:hypothetical protein